MRFFPDRRAQESLADQVAATGAYGGYAVDPIDNDVGYRRANDSGRPIPQWTLDKAAAFSVAAYGANPMARAIIDTYVSFCVGDSGVTMQASNPEVFAVADAFWRDPRVRLGHLQPAFLRDHLIMGETLIEMLVGDRTGVCRWSPIDTKRITGVQLLDGNPLWHGSVTLRKAGIDETKLSISQPDDVTGLRVGDCLFWPSFRALLTDRRGFPFLGPILDDIDSYDTVISNLVDRTAVARYIAAHVTLKGENVDQKQIDEWIRGRGGNHLPKSGTIEVSNESVDWSWPSPMAGSYEDTNTAKSILTNVAGGAGLAKTWLADPEDSNRATSLTMAEPVRRRVGGVQNIWIDYQTEMVRFVVDQAVAHGRLPATVTVRAAGGSDIEVPSSQAVTVHGPEIAATDAHVNAMVLVSLAQAIDGLATRGALSPEAAKEVAQKGWEMFMGVPYRPELDKADGSTIDDLAAELDGNPGAGLRLA